MGQADAIRPPLWHQKQSPFLVYCSYSSGVNFFGSLITSMSMVLGSLVILGEEEND